MWVKIPAPDTGWIIFTLICCKNVCCLLPTFLNFSFDPKIFAQPEDNESMLCCQPLHNIVWKTSFLHWTYIALRQWLDSTFATYIGLISKIWISWQGLHKYYANAKSVWPYWSIFKVLGNIFAYKITRNVGDSLGYFDNITFR